MFMTWYCWSCNMAPVYQMPDPWPPIAVPTPAKAEPAKAKR